MITAERLNQMDTEATTITARGTVAGIALGTFVLELTAEVRRLQAERAAVRAAFVQPGTEPVTEDLGKLARIVIEQLSEEVARVERMDAESAAAIERISAAHIADKWNATAEWQARALKAEAKAAKLEEDLEDARRMYREDMTDFEDEDPTC